MAKLELLTTSQMARADQLAIASGVPSLTLMENAGRSVADEAVKMLQPEARIFVLCGPGNNGGDGFVAARLLAERGYDVDVMCLVALADLIGDAAVMAKRWADSRVVSDTKTLTGKRDLIIDAMFGAGLSRPVDGKAAALVKQANTSDTPILAVDVPSGLDGTTGSAAGPVITATRTVTFFRRKPGHLLLPGRELCGDVIVADIGIPTSALSEIDSKTSANAPALWQAHFPSLSPDSHKYTRGHAVVVSGPPSKTGAARLAARGALRIGAGLVTVASPAAALAINAAHLTAIMVAEFEGPRGLADILSDHRLTATLIGPGTGVSLATRLLVQVVLEFDSATVLDADALTAFTLDQDDDADPVVGHLFTLIKENSARPVVMTPHEGEFKRIFPDLANPSDLVHSPNLVNPKVGSKLERARQAAHRSGATIILKGADTVIASPDGRAAINTNAPPTLATAGSGDVLAGLVTGLLAQRMPAFEAACAAVWLHSECANLFGPGLIAEDLPQQLPKALAHLFGR